MKILLLLSAAFMMSISIHAQDTTVYKNSADRLLSSDNRFMLGGYGEVHYNQPLKSGERNNGSLDVHRMVMLFGYTFNSKTQFISEIEYEHVSEVFIEQAFLQYKLKNYLIFRAGLMLIPMGIINEYHEPVTFNGVERPVIDTKISPTTWREIGVGVTGNILGASMKYQLYLVNGFNGYDSEARLDGKNGFRNGRQKGAESYISSPNLTARVEYYGIRGLNAGLSGYFGKSQSKLLDGIDKDDKTSRMSADSSVVGLAMLGLDSRYQRGGLQLRGQLYYNSVSNTSQYNEFTAENGISNDLGSAMIGYSLEAGYDVLALKKDSDTELIVFARYEKYNTHFSTANGLPKNASYNGQVITSGITLKPAKGAVIKSDIQFMQTSAGKDFTVVFNAGVGVTF